MVLSLTGSPRNPSVEKLSFGLHIDRASSSLLLRTAGTRKASRSSGSPDLRRSRSRQARKDGILFRARTQVVELEKHTIRSKILEHAMRHQSWFTTKLVVRRLALGERKVTKWKRLHNETGAVGGVDSVLW